jgi:hypothetical protein
MPATRNEVQTGGRRNLGAKRGRAAIPSFPRVVSVRTAGFDGRSGATSAPPEEFT